MKERPILFKAPMVQAILSGQKTQTRRVIKPQPQMVANRTIEPWSGNALDLQRLLEKSGKHCPYGQPGDRLWVREKFQSILAPGVEFGDANWKTGAGYAIGYPATDGIQECIDEDDNITARCKPPIHMPRWASRILLEVVGVRVERLQDISEADAIAEGVTQTNDPNYFSIDGKCLGLNARESYANLWESINGTGSIDDNPWVWVVEFKKIGGAA